MAVEGASFVTAYDRRNALRVASQLNAGGALDEKVAHVVAQREGVKVVLAGGIVADGTGYRVSVRGISPADGSSTLISDVRAANKDDVLNAIGRLSQQRPQEPRATLNRTDPSRQRDAERVVTRGGGPVVLAGQELTRQTRDEEAIPYFKRATELDPNFGRAYSAWGTAAFKIGRQDEAEANHKKALSLLDRMTERERYRTLGVYYLAVSKNYDKAIENFSTLVKEYPSDAAAYGNLAVAYEQTRFPECLGERPQSPRDLSQKSFVSIELCAVPMYAGDFKASATEAANLLKKIRTASSPTCRSLSPPCRGARPTRPQTSTRRWPRSMRGRRHWPAPGWPISPLFEGEAKTRSICSPPGFAPTRRPRLSPERQ